MSFKEHSQKIIKESGGRMTKTKVAVVEILHKSKTALPPHAIAKKISKIDVVTVYRILENFLKLGLVHKTEKGFIRCQDHECTQAQHCHHLFTCKNCSTVEEIHIDDRDFLKNISKDFKNLTINSHNFYFAGLCKNCQT